MTPHEKTAREIATEIIEEHQGILPKSGWCSLCTEKIAAALSRTEKASLRRAAEWQPIETAPKDGTPILAGWADTNFHAMIVHHDGARGWCTLLPDMDVHEQPEPTHWMQLPEPPAAQSLRALADAPRMTKDHDPVPPVNHGTADARRGARSALAAVIARLERATEGSAKLDAAIHTAVFAEDTHWPSPFAHESEFGYTRDGRWHKLLKVSRSIDAALSLVPEGWTRAVDASAPELGIDVELFGPDDEAASATHASEPIATCIAALKARLSSLPGESDAAGERSSPSAG